MKNFEIVARRAIEVGRGERVQEVVEADEVEGLADALPVEEAQPEGGEGRIDDEDEEDEETRQDEPEMAVALHQPGAGATARPSGRAACPGDNAPVGITVRA